MIKDFDKLYQEVFDVSLTPDNPTYHGAQIKEEFIQAWDELNKIILNCKSTFTFLEIGAYKGLWALKLAHICKNLNKNFKYTTITWLDQDPNNHEILKVKNFYKKNNLTFNLINSNSQDISTIKKLNKSYDVVFIDADHRYEGVLKDIELYSPLAKKLLIFHDIRPIISTSNCGVYKAIKDSNIILDKEIVTTEDKMGIGLKFI